jgi:hypothetical protein
VTSISIYPSHLFNKQKNKMTNKKPTKEQIYKDKIKAEILEFFQLNEETAWSLKPLPSVTVKPKTFLGI